MVGQTSSLSFVGRLAIAPDTPPTFFGHDSIRFQEASDSVIFAMPRKTTTNPPGRKGYSRRADIPKELLHRLNRGEEPTITLSEWLAVDFSILAKAVLTELGEPSIAHAVSTQSAQDARDGLGVLDRLRSVARSLDATLTTQALRRRIARGLADHRSDIPRQWAALLVVAEAKVDLPRRLELARPFAADPHMGVREIAWLAARPAIAADLDLALQLLEPWTRDPDPNVRRFATEATRPRGVWCEHLEPLKADPAKAATLLENVRNDPARYVQLSAANWLNDASKTKPGAAWVHNLTARWLRESPTDETRFIVNRALRTVRKAGKPSAPKRTATPRPRGRKRPS
jgi:3-methyladenine DNA glycosylase AlkC